MTIIAHDFKERTLRDNSASTEEEFDMLAGTFTAVRQFVGPWEKRFDFIDDYIGIEATEAGNNTGFAGGAAYPDNPIGYAAKIKIKGEGKPSHNTATGQAQFERAVITVTYISRNYNQGSGQAEDPNSWTESLYLEEEHDFSVEMLSIPGKDIKRVDNAENQHDNGPFNLPIIFSSFILRQHQILRPHWQEINALLGTVNSVPFITPSGRWAEAGTLRYDGLHGATRFNVATNGVANQFKVPMWTLTHKFEYNPRGWNNRWIDGAWRPIVLDNGANLFVTSPWFYAIFFGFNGATFSTQLLLNLQNQIQQLNNLLNAGIGEDDPLVIQIRAAIRSILQQLGFNV